MRLSILYRSLCDSTVQYTYFSLPNAGKPVETPNDYYVTGTDNYTKYLVNNTIRGKNCIRGRNISLDRYFTSLSIADWCREQKITVTGTLRKDRILPKEMKVEAGREEKSTKWCFSNDCSIEQQPNILMNLFQMFLLELEGYKDLL